jgi:tRNA(Ile)-lysidine synthase
MNPRGSDDPGAIVEERVQTAFRRWRERGLGPGVVVAVSGGGDSVGLLRALHEAAPGLGLKLSVAHLDHGVRGEAAEADARFVAEVAATLGLPCDLGRWSPKRPGHFEADARRARYAWLAEVAHARNARAVAVGHTRDDQAETILHRILRGTGLRGLAGIPARRRLDDAVTLIRPLLAVSRREIRAYLAALGQDYRDDATNDDVARTRARLRHDLLPRLAAEYNPRVAEALVRLGHLADAADREARGRLRRWERRVLVESGPAGLVLDGDALRRMPVALRAELLRRAWRDRSWPESAMDAARWRRLVARALSSAPGRSQVGGLPVEVLADGRVRLGPRPSPSAEPVPSPPKPVELPGSTPWGVGRLIATLDPDSPADERIDLDHLALPLRIGPPGPGDRFAPLGMEGRHQALADFLRGRRVPPDERALVPVVRDQAGIVWVVGHRIDHRVRRTEATRRLLGLRWERDPSPEGSPESTRHPQRRTVDEAPDALDPDAVHDRESFLAFVAALAADRRAAAAAENLAPSGPYGPDAGGWENVSIEDFLEAALAWAESTGMGTSQGLPAAPTWRGLAAFLYCGKVYE